MFHAKFEPSQMLTDRYKANCEDESCTDAKTVFEILILTCLVISYLIFVLCMVYLMVKIIYKYQYLEYFWEKNRMFSGYFDF